MPADLERAPYLLHSPTVKRKSPAPRRRTPNILSQKHLYNPQPLVQVSPPMMTSRKFVRSLLAAAVLLGGCSSGSFYNTAITNLTPSRLPRNPEGLYLVEAHWRSNQQSIRKDSFKAQVKIGEEFFPMRPTPMLPNRWEALIPIAADKKYINYQFKFDYLINGIPAPRADSKLSASYQLEISEP